jgi:hypothetical protein
MDAEGLLSRSAGYRRPPCRRYPRGRVGRLACGRADDPLRRDDDAADSGTPGRRAHQFDRHAGADTLAEDVDDGISDPADEAGHDLERNPSRDRRPSGGVWGGRVVGTGVPPEARRAGVRE